MDRVDLLAVNAPNEPFSSRGILIEPIDVLSLAAAASGAGWRVAALDMDGARLPAERFQARVEESFGTPRIVVAVFDYHIPLHSDAAARAASEIGRQARMMGALAVAVGKAASLDAGFREAAQFDVFVEGEAEPAILALLESAGFSEAELSVVPGIWFRSKDGVLSRTPRAPKAWDMAKMPSADRGLVDLGDYIDVRTALTSRGCHMGCSFCHVPGFWGGWRGRPAGSVVEELLALGAAGHGKILLLDDNATVGRRRMLDICEGLVAGGSKAAFGCLSSADRYDEELMGKMREAGFCWLHYGAESGDARLLADIGKRGGIAALERAVKGSRRQGFRTRTSWIMDLPGADAASFERGADLMLDLGSDEIRLHFLALRLGSRLGEREGIGAQYIHKGAQNQNLSSMGEEELCGLMDGLLAKLAEAGYAIVKDPDEFCDLAALGRRSKDFKIASLCPLRYGLGWRGR